MINFNERFLSDINSVNCLFNLLEINEKLRKFENSEKLEEFCKFPIGINDKNNFVMVVAFRNEEKLDYDHIDEVVSKIEKEFNKKVIVHLISKKPPSKQIDIFSKQDIERIDITHILDKSYKKDKNVSYDIGDIFNRKEKMKNILSNSLKRSSDKSELVNVLKNVGCNKKFSCSVREMNDLFKKLEINEQLVEIEKSYKNKEIFKKIKDDFVAFNTKGECVIVDNLLTSDGGCDENMFDELAYHLWNHFKKPVKSIIICPFLNKRKSGFYIHRIGYNFE